MLSRDDNELLTNTDAGTPMGELMRRFWLPVALSDDLPGPDCIPVRVRVLNEDLIAFRDSSGRPGLVDAYCPHRGASLFFGRNEEDGLRCVYHGWKFDVTGACVDMPNTPEGDIYRQKLRVTAYPCLEAGSMVWAYMGPPELLPPFPDFDFTTVPASHRYITKFRLECNYLQAMEGDYDPSHAAFLHMSLAEKRFSEEIDAGELNLNTTAGGLAFVNPEVWGDLEDTPGGVICTTSSQKPDGSYFASAGALWMMPVFCTGAIASLGIFSGNIRVPIDNHSLMFYRLRWSHAPLSTAVLADYKAGGYYYPEMVPGSLRPRDNLSNDYNIDRLAQKTFSFSGIKSFPAQDAAMVENQWGPLADRRREHLTRADTHIIHMRRRLLTAAKAMAEGIEPPEARHPEAYGYRYGTAIAPTREAALEEARRLAMRPRDIVEALAST